MMTGGPGMDVSSEYFYPKQVDLFDKVLVLGVDSVEHPEG